MIGSKVVFSVNLFLLLVFSAATQGWFINKLRWFEIIIFFIISISFLSPEFVLNKFYPKFNYTNLNDANIVTFQPNKDVNIKITRPSPYGERYKLFEIKKGTFDEEFSLENYGLSLVKKDNKIIVDTLDWKGEITSPSYIEIVAKVNEIIEAISLKKTSDSDLI